MAKVEKSAESFYERVREKHRHPVAGAHRKGKRVVALDRAWRRLVPYGEIGCMSVVELGGFFGPRLTARSHHMSGPLPEAPQCFVNAQPTRAHCRQRPAQEVIVNLRLH